MILTLTSSSSFFLPHESVLVVHTYIHTYAALEASTRKGATRQIQQRKEKKVQEHAIPTSESNASPHCRGGDSKQANPRSEPWHPPASARKKEGRNEGRKPQIPIMYQQLQPSIRSDRAVSQGELQGRETLQIHARGGG